ncbi:ClpP/crotonase-like domain-containing protein [Aspergillus crustosus]
MATSSSSKDAFPELRNYMASPQEYSSATLVKTLDAETRSLLMERIIKAIETYYLDREATVNIATTLRASLSRGVYDEITDRDTFAAIISTDMQRLTGDQHFRCLYGVPPDEPSGQVQLERLERSNYGFGKINILPGNIVSVEIKSFVPIEWNGVRGRIDAIMPSIADANALIIDLRHNRGGDPKTVAFIASYLLGNEPTTWLKFISSADGEVEDICTQHPAPAKRVGPDKPIFAVTSSATISGGEDLSYGLQALKRATIVGETTAGAANLPRSCVLGNLFTLFVPHRRPVHPLTGGNWEGGGVVPDIAVAAVEAFNVAYELAMTKLGIETL